MKFLVFLQFEGGKVEILDPELKKATSLSTEDSRFMDYLVRRVLESTNGEITPDGTCKTGCKRQGADDWVRKAFWVYFVRLAAVVEAESEVGNSNTDVEKMSDSFSPAFVSTWRETRNFQLWDGKEKTLNVADLRHPFVGSVGISDMKIKFAQISQ